MTRSRSRRWASVAATALMLAAPVAVAQTAPQDTDTDPVAALLQAEVETVAPATPPVQDALEVRTTQALNAEILAQNELADNQERADAEAYQAAQAAWSEDTAAAEAERARYDAQVSAAAETQARYEAALADWQATEQACRTGDRARCRAGRQQAAPLR